MKAARTARLAGHWVSLRATSKELMCEPTLVNGQCFGWQSSAPGEWSGVVGNCLVSLKQESDDVLYMERFPGDTPGLDARLRDYFQLDRFSLAQLYDTWMKADPHFKEIGTCIRGVRVLRQDPVECLFSFLCSQNNNISRITGMLSKLRAQYGTLLCHDEAGQPHFTFPSISSLRKATEQELRDLGFGYRAKYVVATAKTLQEKGGEKWLLSLRTKPRDEVQQALLELHGVGRKVADCVALFSLDQLDCIPVDTHVWAIACRDYKKFLPKLHESKSITDTVYRAIGDFFRSHFQTRAGWAHSVLFTAELRPFRKYLPPHLWVAAKGEKKVKLEKKTPVKEEPLLIKQEQESQTLSLKRMPKLETPEDNGGISIKTEAVIHHGPTIIKSEKTRIKKEVAQKVLAAVIVKQEHAPTATQPIKKRKRLSEMGRKP